MKVSELKIGDIVYYQATQTDIADTCELYNEIGHDLTYGGMDVGTYWGITETGRFLQNSIITMKQSLLEKQQLKITNINPLGVKPIFLTYRSMYDDYLIFPSILIGRIYDFKGEIIEE